MLCHIGDIRADAVMVITLRGRFTYLDYADFRKCIGTAMDRPATRVVLDLSGVEFMDSAALGMLLLAREEAEKRARALILAGAGGQAEKVLSIARFDQIFEIVDAVPAAPTSKPASGSQGASRPEWRRTPAAPPERSPTGHVPAAVVQRVATSSSEQPPGHRAHA